MITTSEELIEGLSPNEVLLEIIQQERITPYFQPVVDLFNGRILGYEVLARGVPPLESAPSMFEKARQMGLGWYLERVCRNNTFRRIASLPDEIRNGRFFVNVSPYVFNDPRFPECFSPETLAEFGLDQKRVVIEITEAASKVDYGEFQDRIRHYTSQGFNIALDDFGTGAASLVMLVAVTPHFLKLDQSIVRDIHKHNYKQLVLKTLVSFSSGVDTKLIAEGVENMEEMDVLVRLGVRYAQGYLLARPNEDPPEVSAGTLADVRACIRKHSYANVELDKTIMHLVSPACTVHRDELSYSELDRLFYEDRTLDHVVILEDEEICGLVTREHFYMETAGARQKFCLLDPTASSMCKVHPMIVEDRISVTALAKMAMSRRQDDLYDPIIVTDNHGKLTGTVTMKHIISRSAELEVNQAFGANPLTKLPGNRSIQEWIHAALNNGPFSLIYADLGRFKEYNDAYGFIKGDDMILMTARVLREHLYMLEPEAKLGHVGGDDFVIVCSNETPAIACQAICRDFDRERIKYFNAEDVEHGYYFSTDRRGKQVQLPLVSLSLVVINSDSFDEEPHPAFLVGIAASLQKRIKHRFSETGQSGYIIERRQYEEH